MAFRLSDGSTHDFTQRATLYLRREGSKGMDGAVWINHENGSFTAFSALVLGDNIVPTASAPFVGTLGLKEGLAKLEGNHRVMDAKDFEETFGAMLALEKQRTKSQ